MVACFAIVCDWLVLMFNVVGLCLFRVCFYLLLIIL